MYLAYFNDQISVVRFLGFSETDLTLFLSDFKFALIG